MEVAVSTKAHRDENRAQITAEVIRGACEGQQDVHIVDRYPHVDLAWITHCGLSGP